MANLIDYAVGNARSGVENIDPAFGAALTNYFGANPGLSMYSGFRSIERQRELFNASDRSGRMVARPGHSFHNFGKAADLQYEGTRLDRVPRDVRERLHKSAAEFGLEFPMSWEPWHVQPIGAKRGSPASPSAPPVEEPVQQAGGVPFTPSAALPMQQNPMLAGLMANNGGQDFLSNTNYSGDAILSDLFRGQNPLKRMMYQRISNLFSGS